jgi:type VI secretion system protein ImpA
LAPEEIRDQAQISAAFQECDPEALKETASLVKDVLAQVRTLEDTLTRQVGVSKAASFGALTGALKTISKFLDARLAERGLGMEEAGGEEEAAAEGATAAVGGAPAARGGVPGDIASRDDVIRVLDRICAYYDRCEPSSPVPILLKRARRLVPMGFLDIVRDLAPGGVDQVELIRGTDASA